ncbi:hypothetical protein ACFYMI_23680 [Streptomyces collinus]|uniref:hypothetical protein n=1 Tax=Streptomyces collinus TaxID=42684 RepID=UPI0036838E56
MTTPTEAAAEGIVHLRAAGVSLVLDLRGDGLPDALERQSINRWTQLLLPPELIGSQAATPARSSSPTPPSPPHPRRTP